MKKLLITTIAFTALVSGAAFADDPSYPGAIERGRLGSPPAGVPGYPGNIERGRSSFDVGDGWFTSGRALVSRTSRGR